MNNSEKRFKYPRLCRLQANAMFHKLVSFRLFGRG